MITTIISLLGGGMGAIMRILPFITKFFEAKGDRDHEFRMTELQLKIDEARSKQNIDAIHAQGEVGQITAEAQAYIEAIKAQGTMSGVPWIDGLNQSVRPVVTYWWMALLTFYKLVMVVAASIELYIAMKAVQSIVEFGPALEIFAERVWSPQDAGILSMILGFWFVDRAIRHQQNS